MSIILSDQQREIADLPTEGLFLITGAAGTGKTTASVERLKRMCGLVDDPDSIIILAPQRSLANPYLEAIRSADFQTPAPHSIMTIGGLSQRSISLFWPLIAREAGFIEYKKPPIFLTLELTQFYLSRLVEPLLQKGYFSSIAIDSLRLYSQIIDNLNKSAVVGFDPTTISSRLTNAWAGKNDQVGIFDQVEECALLFRKYCFEHNLLDFSLQIQVFKNSLWKSFVFRQYLKRKYQHLIYENVEEDYPVAHDIVEEWLPDLQSAAIINDENGGFRTFLGADPISAKRFFNLVEKTIFLQEKFAIPPEISSLSMSLTESIINHTVKGIDKEGLIKAFEVQSYRFFPESLESISLQVKRLIEEDNVPPGEIAILTPFLSDSLLFSATERFSSSNIPITAFRPSRGLKDEPAIKAFLTFAKLAFPSLGLIPEKEDVRNALMTTISGCDLIRADMLAQMLFSVADKQAVFRPYDTEKNIMRERVTRDVGIRFEKLRNWLVEFSTSVDADLDVFLSRLFGELLSQTGFNFHSNIYQATLINQLILSCRKFRQTVSSDELIPKEDLGKTYIQLIENGLLSSQFVVTNVANEANNYVLIAPAHSFLMQNKPVNYQFWLDIGSSGWWARLDQPLTQPYVLSRNWEEGSRWTDVEEYTTNQQNLARLVVGLLARCSKKVYLVSVDVNQQGNEERGALMMAVQTLLKKLHKDGMVDDV